GGIIPEEYAVEYVADRVETTATVWLGLTLGCARCHSHKFDPISQEEFYKFFAFFNNVPENGRAVKFGNSPPMIKAPKRAQEEQLDALKRKRDELERQAQAREPEIASAQAEWESSQRAATAFDWRCESHVVAHFGLEGTIAPTHGQPSAGPHFRDGKPRFVAGAVGSAVALDGRGYIDAGDLAGFGFYDKFTLSAWIRPSGARSGTIISRMADQPQGEGYSVVLERGKAQVNLVKRWLDDAIRVETENLIPAGRWMHLAVTYDGSRLAGGIRIYLDGKPAPFAVLLDELNQSFQT